MAHPKTRVKARRNTASARGVTLTVGMILVGANACTSEVNSTITSGRSALSKCSTPTANGNPLPGCERFEVLKVNKIVVKPGEEVTLTGRNFRSGMILAASSPSQGGGGG